MTDVTGESVLPVENIFPQKSPTGITESRVTSVTEQFPVHGRVRLACDPSWQGNVIAHDPDGAVKVTFRIGDMLLATGKHSPAALERIEP